MIFSSISLKDHLFSVQTTKIVGNRTVWIPARPLNNDTFLSKLKQAWLVLTNKADVVKWDT